MESILERTALLFKEEGIIKLKNAHVAFPTIKYHAFFKHCNALKFLRPAVNAGLQEQFDIKAHGDRVEPAIELHGIKRDIGPTDLSALHTYRNGMLNNLLTVIGEIHANVFKAITISAGIQDSVGFNAHSFLGMTGTVCESVLHSNTSVV